MPDFGSVGHVFANSSDEGASIVEDLTGISVYKGAVKVVSAEGITTVIGGGADEDFTLYGVYNGAFAQGPDDRNANIDPANTATGSNFVPSWRFIQSSNTNITASMVRDLSSPSGSNFRFTIASGAAADAAVIEQIVPIGGSRARWNGDNVRTYFIAGAGNTGSFNANLYLQYLTADRTITGMPAEQTTSVAGLAAGTSSSLQSQGGITAAPPSTARYLRIRVGMSRGSAGTTTVGTIDISDVRRDWARPYILVGENGTPGTYAAGSITQAGGQMTMTPGGSIPTGSSAAALALYGGLRLLSILSPAQIVAAANNYNPTGLAHASILRLSTDASRNLTGLVPTSDGQVVLIQNVGSFNLVIIHEGAGSTAANRFSCPNVTDYTLNQKDGVLIWYSVDDTRWYLVAA